MDVHVADGGVSTSDKAHRREEFRLLLDDISRLPETQRSALVLREMDALSYEQIADAMETTVPSVKSLLVRARIGLAEAAQARKLTCEEVRIELGARAEGIGSITARRCAATSRTAIAAAASRRRCAPTTARSRCSCRSARSSC